MNDASNVRAAPREMTPRMVERLLTIIESVCDTRPDARPACPPRLRLGAPTPKVNRPLQPHPLEQASAALSFLRRSGVSASVAETSALGTTWWVSGYPAAIDAAGIIELAKKMGFIDVD